MLNVTNPGLKRRGTRIVASIANITLLLSRVITRLNCLTGKVEWKPTEEAENWEEVDKSVLARVQFELSHHVEIEVGTRDILGIFEALATDVYHPIRDAINGTEWDGVPRIATFASRYFAASDEIEDTFMFRWFLAGYRRLTQPGIQADNVPVLVGGQGVRKTSVCRALSLAHIHPRAFLSLSGNISKQDVLIAVARAFVVELEEMEILRNKPSQVNGFVTRREEPIRRVYQIQDELLPRSSVFIGNTDKMTFLQDPVGSRRWWPIRCKMIDCEAVEADSLQCWAEAAYIVNNFDEQHWLTDEENAERIRHNAKFTLTMPLFDELLAVIQTEQPRTITVASAFDMLDIPVSARTTSRVAELVATLRTIPNYEEKVISRKGVPTQAFRRLR